MHLPAITPLTFLVWIVFGAVAAFMAKRNGKNPLLWFFLGALFGVFGLFFLFFSSKKKAKEGEIVVEPKPAPQGVFWYYLDTDNRQRGPFSLDVLKQAWQEGKLTPQSYVWNQTLDKWEPFGQFIRDIP